MRCLIFEVCERGTEAPTLGPNVQTTADEFFEGQASSLAFVTRVLVIRANDAVRSLGKKGNSEHCLFLLN